MPKNSTELCPHHTQKTGYTQNSPHQVTPPLVLWRQTLLSSQPRTGTVSPLFLSFLHFSFSSTTSRKALRRPNFCKSEQDPTKSQSWSPGGSWGDTAPVRVVLTPTLPPPCSRGQTVRTGSEEMGLPSQNAHPQGGSERWAHIPFQPMGERRTNHPHLSSGPHFSEGSFTASIKLGKIKLKQNQVTHNFSKIVTEQLTENCSARCPNPWAGREKASKTMQFTKREVYYWLESGLSAATNVVAQGQKKPWAEAVNNIYQVCIRG